MNIFKRVRNLWRLSSAIVVEKDALPNSINIRRVEEEKPKKLAEIIKRETAKDK